MALVTSQQLANYYEKYADTEVSFTKEVVRALGLRVKQTYLRFLGYQIQCIIYSSSMKGAKVIANVGPSLFAKIREANNLVSLRFCFDQSDKLDPMAFFVGARIAGFSPYNKEHPDLNFITLTFTQRPSDELISLLGTLIEANTNASKRSEERIVVTPETLRRLGLKGKQATLFINNVPRTCIIRDLSFSGARVLATGIAKFVVDQPAVLKMDVDDHDNGFTIAGKVIRFEEVEGRTGIGAIAVQFDARTVPMQYKLRLNEYLVSGRKPSG